MLRQPLAALVGEVASLQGVFELIRNVHFDQAFRQGRRVEFVESGGHRAPHPVGLVLRSINPNEEGKTTMTDYDINVPGDTLSRLLSEKNGLAALVEVVLNQVLDAQASEQVGAQWN